MGNKPYQKLRKCYRNIVILLLLLLHALSFAQEREVRFEHLTIEDGLSQNTINCILQDSLGFMWFGTQDGLSRYDGYQFKNYKSIPGDSTALPSSNWVEKLCLDQHNRLWIGTGNGLCSYNIEQDNFRQYDCANEPIPHDRIKALMTASNGDVWVGSLQGLSKFTTDAEGDITWQHLDFQLDNELDVKVNAIYEDHEGTIWVGTANQGLLRLPKGDIHAQAKIFQDELSDINVKVITQDEQQNLWVGTQNGLTVLSSRGELIHQYFHDRNDPKSLSENWIVSLFKDQKGTLWIGTYAHGLCKYLPESNSFQRFQKDMTNPYSLSDNNIIKSIYEDHTGILWVGTLLGGVNYYDAFKMKFPHYKQSEQAGKGLNDNIMRAFYKDQEGLLWIGTQSGGLNCLDMNTGKFTYYLNPANNSNVISSNYIKSVTRDAKGRVWVATRRDGLYRIDFKGQRQRIKHYVHDPNNPHSLGFNQVSAVTTDKLGRVWVLDHSGRLHLYREETDDFEQVVAGSLQGNIRGLCLFIDSQNLIWMGCYRWVKVLNPETGEMTTYENKGEVATSLPKANIKSIHEGKNGIMWLGSSVGLLRLDRKKGFFSIINTKDGLPNDMVYAAYEVADGHVWMSTNKGICKYNPATKQVKSYDITDGLQSNEFNTGAHHLSEDGVLVFGGINGFNAFKPENIEDNPHAPKLAFTDFQLFSRPVPIRSVANPTSPLQQNIVLTNSLSLSHRDYVILWEFAALHFSDPAKNRYAYKLENFETNWNYINAARRAITYTNLPPGDYVFRVKASNSDGVWDEEGISMNLSVSPPWYQIVWVKIVIFLVLIAGFIIAYTIRVSTINRQKEVLERTVEERTREILEKNQELKQQQAKILAQRDRIENSYENVKVMSEIGKKITSLLDQESLINQLYQQVNSLMDATGFGVGLVQGGRLVFSNFIERNEVLADFSASLDEQHKLAVWCIEQNEPVFINDIEIDFNRYISKKPDVLEGDFPRSLIYVPLTIEDEVVGVTTVQSFSKNAYTEYHLNLLLNLAAFITVALTNARTYEQLNQVKKEIEVKNLDMLDSIRYAETIQNVLLPPQEEIQAVFEDYFIFFKPKDIVSGDFYWLSEWDGKYYFAVVDCTGHGVPGAFMSIIGHNLLDEILHQYGAISPAQILVHLNRDVKKILRQQEAKNADGMDVSLCCIDKQQRQLTFSGAKRPLWYMEGEELVELKGDRKSIGGYHKNLDIDYTDQTIDLRPDMMFYMASDGFADQNNPKGKKMGSARFKAFLTYISSSPIQEQGELAAKCLAKHKGNQPQRDDIVLIGFKVNCS